MITKTEIDKNTQLNAGDVIEMHFNYSGGAWVKDVYIALAENQISKNPRYLMQSQQYLDTEFIFTLKIVNPNPADIPAQEAGISPTLIAAGILAMGTGLFFYLSLSKVYKIMDSPAGKIAVAGMSLGFMLTAAAVVLYFWKGIKK